MDFATLRPDLYIKKLEDRIFDLETRLNCYRESQNRYLEEIGNLKLELYKKEKDMKKIRKDKNQIKKAYFEMVNFCRGLKYITDIIDKHFDGKI